MYLEPRSAVLCQDRQQVITIALQELHQAEPCQMRNRPLLAHLLRSDATVDFRVRERDC